jgi:beta-N-acetylhexosaminidase
MKKPIVLFLIIIMAFGLMGCNGNGDDEKIGIRGIITNVSMNEKQEVTNILVEGKVESDTSFDKASVFITKGTKVNSPEKLKKGMKVEVVFTGPIAESYPVQGRAKVITVIE